MKTTAAQRAQQVREFLGLNTRQFALSIDSDPGTYAKMEKGARNLSKGVMLAIARTYEVNLDWLADGQGEMFASTSSDTLEEIGPLPTVTHSQAQKALADKAMQNREKLDKTALEVLAMYVANPSFLLIGDHGRISVIEADHKTIARNAYSQASEMISEAEHWVRVN